MEEADGCGGEEGIGGDACDVAGMVVGEGTGGVVDRRGLRASFAGVRKGSVVEMLRRRERRRRSGRREIDNAW